MKKILFALPLLFAMLFAACDASTDDIQPGANVTVEELTNSFELIAKSTGNNNITVQLSPVHYVKVYRADNDALLAEGTNPSFQVTPPTTDLGVYITTINPDGSLTKSDTKNITITEYTDLPAIFEQVFGLENGVYGTTTWTWDDTVTGNYWGNGGWGSSTSPDWGWGAPDQVDINQQATDKGFPQDGIGGWFTLSLNGVETSRGETGTVSVTGDVVKAGWDIGSMKFSGTVPLLGVQPNGGNARQYEYLILKADDNVLRLCAPEPGAGDWGTAWFWNFKKK